MRLVSSSGRNLTAGSRTHQEQVSSAVGGTGTKRILCGVTVFPSRFFISKGGAEQHCHVSATCQQRGIVALGAVVVVVVEGVGGWGYSGMGDSGWGPALSQNVVGGWVA